jgi:hypothetical protein
MRLCRGWSPTPPQSRGIVHETKAINSNFLFINKDLKDNEFILQLALVEKIWAVPMLGQSVQCSIGM